MRDKPLSASQANSVFDVLATVCNVSEDMRPDFVWHQTNEYCSEFRFMGNLGFGGKFWRNTRNGREIWYINAYREDVERWPGMQETIDRANERLEILLQVLTQPDRVN